MASLEIELNPDLVTLFKASNGRRYGTLGGLLTVAIDFYTLSDAHVRSIHWDDHLIGRDHELHIRLVTAIQDSPAWDVVLAAVRESLAEDPPEDLPRRRRYA